MYEWILKTYRLSGFQYCLELIEYMYIRSKNDFLGNFLAHMNVITLHIT